MKSCWSIFVIISVLFMSVDGAADIVIEGHPHSDGASHQATDLEASEQAPGADTEDSSDHCERCCHGHTSSITAQVNLIVAPVMAIDRQINRAPQARKYFQAPPTPPPNA